MKSIHSFLSTTQTSLKVCGVTTAHDANQLASLNIPAIGINFWPSSKRYIPPADAQKFLRPLSEAILRVGVFVNASPDLPIQLLHDGIIDIAQFHGDESPAYTQSFADRNLPFIKAIGVKDSDSLESISAYRADAILLDTHAPGVYGGTGDPFDWNLAKQFITDHPSVPVLLAGGITPGNAAKAAHDIQPAALDVASGSESSPGIKCFDKVAALQQAIMDAQSQ